MLVISRMDGEKFKIGDSIVVTIIETRQGRCRIGIEAPKEIVVDRMEVAERRAASLDPPKPPEVNS